jgi:lipoate---protein ligase
MLIIENKNFDPYINLALEEHFLKQTREEIFMLWKNTDSVIIGKHQNPYSEINTDFVFKNSMPVIRRMSGGGTVFHDLGNLNFTFIAKAEKEKRVDFRRYTSPILETLVDFGVSAYFEGKSNLRIDGLKFSGNAEHIYKDKVLHHGTLLFKSNLEVLNKALKNNCKVEAGRAIRSDRTVVTNLSEFVEEDKFVKQLLKKVHEMFPHSQKHLISREDLLAAEQLAEKKYKTFEWNFGYSPAYEIEFSLKGYELFFSVENGIIIESRIFKAGRNIKELSELFINKRHFYSEIEEALEIFINK